MSTLKRLIPVAIVLLLLLVGISQAQEISDRIRLRGYQPPAQISGLATATTMTGHGTKLFYVNHPQLLDKQAFRQNCSGNEKSIVLGCYINHRGIYLFDVNDQRLAGIEEVTAAHEMLHEAYERLSPDEKKVVDRLTQKAYNDSANDRIRKTLDAYKERDASVVPNELHSIIATEVRNIPPELENYYRKYFRDRGAIVSFSEKYEAEFSKRESLAESYKQQLDSLKSQVDRLNDELTARSQDLSSEYAQLNSNRGEFDAESFNTQAREYNQKVQAYNVDVKYTSSLIDQYNAILSKYQDTVLEENDLLKSIDTRPSAI